MDIGIQIRNAKVLNSVLEGGLALAAGVVLAGSGRSVGTIAVDVQVVVVVVGLEEDCVVQVTTVAGAALEGS